MNSDFAEKDQKQMAMLLEAFDAIAEEHEFSDSYKRQKNRLIRKYRDKKGRSARRIMKIAASVALILAMSAGTVAAAVRIYQFQMQGDGKHKMQFGIVKESGKAGTGAGTRTEIPAVKMQIGFVPENFEENYKGENTFASVEGDRGYIVSEPIFIDIDEASWPVTYVEKSEKVKIGEHEAMRIQTRRGADPDWKNVDLYIMFPEYERVVQIYAWGYVQETELEQFAREITLKPTGEMVRTSELLKLSECLEGKKTMAEGGTSLPGKHTATDQEMKNLHKVGDTLKLSDRFSVDFPECQDVEIKVADVQIRDDLSLLQAPDDIVPIWKELLNEEGKLGTDTIQYIRPGDGVNTLDEVIKTTESQLKLVYVTLEYTNTGSEDIEDLYYFFSLLPIRRSKGEWTIRDRAAEEDEICYTIHKTQGIGTGEMIYMDVRGGERNNNYIPLIRAGESTQVNVAWVIDEENLGSLYLNLYGEGMYEFTENDLRFGYVDLNR